MNKRQWLEHYIQALQWATGMTDSPPFFEILPSPREALLLGLEDHLDLVADIEAVFRVQLGLEGECGNFLRGGNRNAFYTHPEIIRSLWAGYITPNYGHGFRLLDAGCGTGHGLLYGSPQIVGSYLGIDNDPIAIAWATRKNPAPDRCQFYHQSFLEVPLVKDSYDVLGFNVPFVTAGRGQQAHSTFFAHAAPAIAPGGSIISFTSTSFLDAVDDRYRKALYKDFDLVIAMRCVGYTTTPTEAPADLVVFRKRKPGERKGPDSWLDSCYIHPKWALEYLEYEPSGEGSRLNEYFLKHPDLIIGGATENTLRMYGKPCSGVSANPVDDLPDRIFRHLSDANPMTTPNIQIIPCTPMSPTPTPEPKNVLEFAKATHAAVRRIEDAIAAAQPPADFAAQIAAKDEHIATLQKELNILRRTISKVEAEYGEVPSLDDDEPIAKEPQEVDPLDEYL